MPYDKWKTKALAEPGKDYYIDGQNTQLIFLNNFDWGRGKGGFKSKSAGYFFIANFAIINILFYYPRLLHPLHSIDKIS